MPLQVRVRQLVLKPLEEIYPVWPGEERGGDIKLDNMIRDILGGCLDESWWEIEEPVVKTKKRKKNLETGVNSDDDFVEPPRRKPSTKTDDEKKTRITKKKDRRDDSDFESPNITEGELVGDEREKKKPIEGMADDGMGKLLKTILDKLNELGTKVELMQTKKPTMEEGSTKKRNEVAEDKVDDAESDAVGENEEKNGCEANREPVSWYMFG